MTSLITPNNGDAAVIIGNRRCDHEFVIIAPVYPFSQTEISNFTSLASRYQFAKLKIELTFKIKFPLSSHSTLSRDKVERFCRWSDMDLTLSPHRARNTDRKIRSLLEYNNAVNHSCVPYVVTKPLSSLVSEFCVFIK